MVTMNYLKLILCIEEFASVLAKGISIDVIYLDFCNAFDLTEHFIQNQHNCY